MSNNNLTATSLAVASCLAAVVLFRQYQRRFGAKQLRAVASENVIGFLFDLDGTLLDFEGASHIALNNPLKKFGVIVDWKLHGAICGKPAHYWSKEVLKALNIEHLITPEDFSKEFHDEIKLAFPMMQLMPGALRLVKTLKKILPQARFAIATSSERHSFDLKMSYHKELLECFDAVVTGNEIPNGKPNPDIFLEAARRINVPIHRCVVFEDAPSGSQAGRRAGATVVAVPDERMLGNESAFSFVDFRLRSLEDIDQQLLDDILHAIERRKPIDQ